MPIKRLSSHVRSMSGSEVPVQAVIWIVATIAMCWVWWLTFSLIEEDRVRVESAARSDLVNLGRLGQEHAERTFYSVDQTLRAVLGQYREHHGKADIRGMIDQGVIDTRLLRSLRVMDSTGKPQQLGAVNSVHSERSDQAAIDFHKGSGRNELRISRPLLDSSAGGVIAVSRGMTLSNGEFGGVVLAAVDALYFTRFYASLNLGHQSDMILFGPDGFVRARRVGERVEQDVGAQVPALVMAFMERSYSEDDTFDGVIEGVARTYHVGQLSSYPLYVAIGLSEQKIFAEHERDRRLLVQHAAVVSALMAALTLVVSWYAATRGRYRQAQQKTLSRLQDLTSHVPGLVFQFHRRTDGSTSFPFASDGLRDIYRLSPDQVVQDASGVMSMIHQDDRESFVQSLDLSAKNMSPWVHEYRVSSDGMVRWLYGNAAPQALADGSVLWHGFISDVTERKEDEELLSTLSAAVEQSPVSIVIVDLKGNITYVNPKFEQSTGYTSAEAVGQNPRLLASGEKSEEEYRDMWNTLLSGKTWVGEFHNKRKDGSLFWEQATISPIMDARGQALHFLAIKEDVTERKRAEAQLRIAAIAFESQEGMFVSNADGVILRVNQAFTSITGYGAEEAIGNTPGMLSSGRHDVAFYAAMRQSIQETGSWQGEIWNRRKNGEIFPEWLTITEVRDSLNQVTHYVSTLNDITLRKAAEDKIKNLAFYDPLTGLANRRLLIDRLERAVIASQRSKLQGALLFIDLDNFKILNDTHGHARGDLLLQQVGQRLVACMREADTVARLGGDEFVVMVEDLCRQSHEAASKVEVLANKILYTLNLPFDLAGNEYHITPSIGIAMLTDQSASADELMKRADLAMYQAKAVGRNTLRFFDPEMQEAVNTRVALERKLRSALHEEQFLLHYQPQVDGQGRLTGVEALVRWQHPELGIVFPGQFIAITEECGLILPLGEWVLETACEQLSAWAKTPRTSHLTISVNVSAMQFHLDHFVPHVLSVLNQTGAPASRLKLELTESLLVKDVEEVIQKMLELKLHGVGFSLDDFGTGYSSLSYLKRLPLDQLKIDQSFLHEALTHANDAAIVRAIVTLGQSLGMAVIAEGVETLEQRDFLLRQGCSHFQGYYYGRPGPVESLDHFFESC